MKFDLGVANKLWVRIDMILALIFGIIIEIGKRDFSNVKNKIEVTLGEKKWCLPSLKKYTSKIVIILIFLISITNIIVNDIYTMGILKKSSGPTNIEDYEFTKKYYENRHKKITEYDDGVFRTTSMTRTGLNDGILFGDHGINHSSSTYSKSLHNFLYKFGYSTEHVLVSNDMGNTKAMDMLFGIKYNLDLTKNTDKSSEIEIDDRIKIYKNPYALSLGFMTSKGVLEDIEFDSYDALKNQNMLLKKIANLDEDIYVKNNGKITEKIENLRKNDEENYIKINKEEPGKAVYEFEIEQNREIYFYISWGINLDSLDFFVNGEKINGGLEGGFNKMIDLGKFEVGQKMKVELEIKEKDFNVVLPGIYVYYENDEILQKYYDVLSKEQVELKKINESKYEGKINVQSNNEYVLFTIPYDKGWSATVDGKKMEIMRVQDEFMAVKLDKGEHVIVLNFIPDGFYIGLTVSAFGIFLFVFCSALKVAFLTKLANK